MIIEKNTLFKGYDQSQNLFRGRYKSFVVYGSSIQQVFRHLLLIVFSNNK